MTTEVRKTVTVVFSDVTGSTSIGERIDPESLRGLLTRYYDEMKLVLERHGGAVRELVGDAMLAVFGAPIAHEDDALRAVRAASEMAARLAELNDELEREWGVRLATRTGINTGEVVVEGTETEQPLVLGDSINVAARLEQAAEPGEILLGDPTYRLVRDAVEVEAVEPLELKGKSEPVAAWRLLELIPLRPGLARRLDSTLVGREQELALLQEAFAKGGSQLVTVLGPAGVGKSRLTQEFVAAIGESATVLMGRCLPYGEGITFWPVAEVVRAAAGMSETDPPESAQAKIAALLDGDDDAEQIAERVAAAIGLVETGAELQEIFWAIRKLLEALAREHPLVCVFDDVDWAEPTFLDLVEHLAGRTHDVPLLLLCLARPELLEVRPSWPSDTSIVLDALSEDDSGQLIAGLLGADALPDEVCMRVGAAAEGNPLFVEELVRMLVDDGLLERENGSWRATGDLTELALPASINALLAARLDRLTPAERAVIQRAAVIGKVFWWGAVAELSPEDARLEVGGHLQTLVRKELVRPDMSSFAGEDGFRFGHILVRDAAYQSIPKAARAELHERFADWLERKAGERASEYEEIIGYHLEQAVRHRSAIGPAGGGLGVGLRAGQTLASAGLRARARGDMAAADNLLSRALVLLPADGAERLEVLPKLADALVETGQLERAEDVFSEALERGDPLARVEIATLKTYTAGEARQDEIADLAKEAIPLLERAGNDAALARAWELLSDVHAIACLWSERADALERALTHALRADDKRAEGQLLAAIAVSLYLGSTPAREGIRRCEEILERTDGRGVEGSVLGALAGFRAMQGDFDEARELYGRGQSIYDDLGLKLRAAARTMIGGRIEAQAGDLPAAERELRSGLDTLEAMGEQNILSTVAGLLARVVYAQGRYEEAEKIAEVSERAAADDDVISQVLWRAARATALACRGESSEAESLAREAVRRIEQTDQLDNHGDTLLDLAEVLRLGGREDEAAPVAAEALKLYEQKENLVSAEKARAVQEQLSGAAPP